MRLVPWGFRSTKVRSVPFPHIVFCQLDNKYIQKLSLLSLLSNILSLLLIESSFYIGLD